MSKNLDLAAYLRRVEFRGALQPDRATLAALHLAHATHIPFENLDILLGRPVRLDIGSVQDKLVRGARGGYCFEHNLLFAAVLEAVGFRVTQLAARVRYRTRRVLPRTHMLLAVEADGASWIADVGFGVWGLLAPLPLAPGPETRQFRWSFRAVEEAGVWTVQSRQSGHEGAWTDLYAFTLEPQHLIDFEMASYYVSTHPESRFTQTLIAQAIAPDARHMLHNRELTVDRGTRMESRILADDDELLEVLGGTFGLRFPSGTRFNYRDS